MDKPILGPIQAFKHVDIIGAGVAGLMLGYHLKKLNIPFTIYEKENFIGGKINTTNTSHGMVETAANAIMANHEVIQVLNSLNIPWISAQKKLKRLLWTSKGVISSPFSITFLFKLIFGLFKKISIKQRDELTIADFFTPWLGQTFVDEIISTGLKGIYADSAENILLSSIWPKFMQGDRYYHFILHLITQKKQNKNYGSISFEYGMQQFITSLKDHLKGQIKTNASFTEFNPQNFTLICTDSHDAAQLLKMKHQNLSSELTQFEYRAVSSTTLFIKKPIAQLDRAFGILFSNNASVSFHSYGILNNSAIFSNRTNGECYSYTFIANGETQLTQIEDDLHKFELHAEVLYQQTTQWQRAIPCYNLQRKKLIEKIYSIMPSNIGLFASYTNGVSLRHMINFAPIIAREIQAHYQTGQE